MGMRIHNQKDVMAGVVYVAVRRAGVADELV